MKAKHTFTSEEKLKLWGNGEWVEEIDYFEGEYREIKYAVIRTPMGHLCGYIELMKSHPWSTVPYMEIDSKVHGGVTYNYLMDDTLIYGFDCAHPEDICPSVSNFTKRTNLSNPQVDGTYKNVAFVKAQCIKFIDEALEVLSASQNPHPERSEEDSVQNP